MARNGHSNRLILRPGPFDGVKVFTATLAADRAALGDAITQWLAEHPDQVPTEVTVTQSSDETHHCLAITVFYRRVVSTR